MLGRSALLLIALLATVSCSTTHNGVDASGETSQPSFQQLRAAPDSFKGQSVVFGGEVLSARRMKEGTRIEILQLPLDGSGYPASDLTQSQGRFVAIQKEFLDPATIPRGTRVTISGDVTGAITLPLDDTEYLYPVVETKRLHVWPNQERSVPRARPYYGPGPHWGPYVGPYWRPWPYW